MKHDAEPERVSPEPKARGRGRPVGDREAQRRKILRAGITVIARDGYAGASLRKVAQEAGHTTGALTYYFADKEALVRAIIGHMFDSFDRLLDSDDDNLDHRSAFKRWLDLNANSESWVAGVQLIANARHEPSFAAIYRERYARYRQRLTGILQRQQAAGTVRNDIPAELLADHIGSIGDGWMIMLPIETERFAPERVDALVDSIMLLLKPTAATTQA